MKNIRTHSYKEERERGGRKSENRSGESSRRFLTLKKTEGGKPGEGSRENADDVSGRRGREKKKHTIMEQKHTRMSRTM